MIELPITYIRNLPTAIRGTNPIDRAMTREMDEDVVSNLNISVIPEIVQRADDGFSGAIM